MYDSATTAKAPVHLWVVGILATLWNAFGCLDYVMTETRNAKWLQSFTPEQLQYFNGFPAWAIAAWAVGVWGALAASLLLLLRKRSAVALFGLSILGMVVGYVYQYGMANARGVFGNGMVGFAAVIALVAIALFLYARAQAGKGVLK